MRVVPGVSPKAAQQALAAVVGGDARARAVFSLRGGDATLAASALDRYMVVQFSSNMLPTVIANLRAHPLVADAFENHRYHVDNVPNDSLYAEQWALARIEAESAWNVTRGDSAVLVGILDTGIDWGHPDLAAAVAVNAAEDRNHNGRFDAWPSTEQRNGVAGDIDGVDQDGNGLADDVIGYDFVDQTVQNAGDWSGRDPIPFDEFGHGTNVAGVVAARAGNGIGIAGAAPGCRLLALRAFDAGGNAEDDDIAAALIYAVDRGARVVNLSFGDYYASPLLHDAIRYAVGKGVVVVASSGNEGGSDPHYPSSFAEVIGVGATDRNDYLAPFTTYGAQLALCAPGVDIVTTQAGGGYKRVSGTSFSSPYVAAAAALIASAHPGWRPSEIRSVLELSADDRGRTGWDLNYGAGRLNMRRALEYVAAADVAIETPEVDEALHAGDSLIVTGSAYSPLLESWSLSLGAGDDPRQWQDIPGPTGAVSETIARVHDRLGAAALAGLTPGQYTLRLTVRQTNGRTTDRRVRLFVDPPKPVVASVAIRNVWRFDQRAVAVTCSTQEPSLLRLWLRQAGSGAPYRAVALEAERTGMVRDHFLLLTADEIDRLTPYDAYLELTNAAGDTTLIGAPQAPLSIIRERDAFSRTTFARKSYDLPYGYVLDDTRSLYPDASASVVLNRFQDGGYGPLVVYGFANGAFTPRDSVAEGWLPRSMGDANGDGRLDILVQSRGTGMIFSRDGSGANPLARSLFVDTTSGDFWADALIDLDGDGVAEVVARTDNSAAEPAYYYTARLAGDTLARDARLPNTTAPASGDSRNKYGPPEARAADFDGDGRLDLLIGDDDADFQIYRQLPDGRFQSMWIDENDGEGGSEFVTSGDLDGDGRQEAIVAYHARVGQSFQRTYAPPFWTIKAFSFDLAGKPSLIWRDSVAYVRPTLPFLFFSGLAAGELNGRPGDELVLSFFPGLYVLAWDSVAKTLRPLWYRDGVIANRPVIADLDGDGRQEIGVGDGTRLSFFQAYAASAGVPAPSGFNGWAVNDTLVHLQWNPMDGAEYYTLYRGEKGTNGAFHFDSVARTTATFINDTGFVTVGGARLEPRRTYYYIVTSRNTALTAVDSLLSNVVAVFTHTPGIIESVTAVNSRAVRVRMSVPLASVLARPGALGITTSGGRELVVSTVLDADPFTLVATLQEDAGGDSLVVRPTWLLRDVFGTPFDTVSVAGVRMPEDEHPGERFLAVRAQLIARDTVAVDFNAPLDAASATVAAAYRLLPGGSIVSATLAPTNPARILLAVGPEYPVGALGVVYTVPINGVFAADGRALNDGAGGIVSFVVTAPNLDAPMVYPHPFSIERDGRCTFAGLTRQATVRIYTQSGRGIATLVETEGAGGVTWDGRDERGDPVPPGVYIYVVNGVAADGSAYESAPSKIAVVP